MERSDAYIQHSMVDPATATRKAMPPPSSRLWDGSLPVITTLHAGIPEAVRDRQEGLLSKEGDADGMAANIVELAQSHSLSESLGMAAWERARSCFTWQHERANILRLTGLEAHA